MLPKNQQQSKPMQRHENLYLQLEPGRDHHQHSGVGFPPTHPQSKGARPAWQSPVVLFKNDGLQGGTRITNGSGLLFSLGAGLGIWLPILVGMSCAIGLDVARGERR